MSNPDTVGRVINTDTLQPIYYFVMIFKLDYYITSRVYIPHWVSHICDPVQETKPSLLDDDIIQ